MSTCQNAFTRLFIIFALSQYICASISGSPVTSSTNLAGLDHEAIHALNINEDDHPNYGFGAESETQGKNLVGCEDMYPEEITEYELRTMQISAERPFRDCTSQAHDSSTTPTMDIASALDVHDSSDPEDDAARRKLKSDQELIPAIEAVAGYFTERGRPARTSSMKLPEKSRGSIVQLRAASKSSMTSTRTPSVLPGTLRNRRESRPSLQINPPFLPTTDESPQPKDENFPMKSRNPSQNDLHSLRMASSFKATRDETQTIALASIADTNVAAPVSDVVTACDPISFEEELNLHLDKFTGIPVEEHIIPAHYMKDYLEKPKDQQQDNPPVASDLRRALKMELRAEDGKVITFADIISGSEGPYQFKFLRYFLCGQSKSEITSCLVPLDAWEYLGTKSRIRLITIAPWNDIKEYKRRTKIQHIPMYSALQKGPEPTAFYDALGFVSNWNFGPLPLWQFLRQTLSAQKLALHLSRHSFQLNPDIMKLQGGDAIIEHIPDKELPKVQFFVKSNHNSMHADTKEIQRTIARYLFQKKHNVFKSYKYDQWPLLYLRIKEEPES